MAINCFGLICSAFFLVWIGVVSSSESLQNGTSVIGNVTEQSLRDGRELDAHPPTADESQSLSPRPKSLGTGTWKAIKIWNEPIGVSSSMTTKRASSPERVVASAAVRSHQRPFEIHHILTLCLISTLVTRFVELS